MDMKLEVVVVPVSDVDRARDFYQALGWRQDADFATGPDFRVVQMTPPGSACAIIFGTGITSATPGTAEGLQLVAKDIGAARRFLLENGCVILREDEKSLYFRDPFGITYDVVEANKKRI